MPKSDIDVIRTSDTLERLLLALPTVAAQHRPGTPLYRLLQGVARAEIEALFGDANGDPVEFGPFGAIRFPYHSMGAIDSLNLFDLDELIILSFYWHTRGRYKTALDIGANLGLHSIVLAKCGVDVVSYEPDPMHFGILEENVRVNDIGNIRCFNMAVSAGEGEVEFIRVLGNTTSGHIAGAKPNPYGELQRIIVRTVAFKSILRSCDLVKMDVEGHEKELVTSTSREDWQGTDGMLSVHDEPNASALFEHFTALGLKLFSQKINWQLVRTVEDMPLTHHDGSVFVTGGARLPWS